MPNQRQQQYIEDLLDLLASRVHRRRHQSRVRGANGYRITEELIDETGIDANNATDNLIVRNIIILDCGHPASANLGGHCHYCDSLVCRTCINICSSCGHSICNLHCVIADFDRQNKPYCRSCADEIRRSLRLRAIGNTILSFFLSNDKNRG